MGRVAAAVLATPTAQEAPSRRQAGRSIRTSACSTSAAAGAGLRSTSRKSAARGVTGITLSQEQWQRAAEARSREGPRRSGGSSACRDYRNIRERVSTASSRSACSSTSASAFYDTYFRACAELLSDDGVMLLHSIGQSEGPNVTNPWKKLAFRVSIY